MISHFAATENNVDLLEKILALPFGVDEDFIDAQNMNGETALHLCTRNGLLDHVLLLVQKVADLNTLSSEGMTIMTALAMAREHGRNWMNYLHQTISMRTSFSLDLTRPVILG